MEIDVSPKLVSEYRDEFKKLSRKKDDAYYTAGEFQKYLTDSIGDIIVQDPTRGKALELSSMGVRVSPESLQAQLKEMGMKERADLEFQSGVIDGTLPLSIGGGIGQSRLCMLLLQKSHIAEVQVSVWPDEMIEEYRKAGVEFL
jgi:aspartate--ammonia ligase